MKEADYEVENIPDILLEGLADVLPGKDKAEIAELYKVWAGPLKDYLEVQLAMKPGDSLCAKILRLPRNELLLNLKLFVDDNGI